MRDFQRRIARLEEKVGHPDCTCAGGPGLQVIVKPPSKTFEQVDSEIASRRFRCRVHGERGPLAVVVTRYTEEPQPSMPATPNDAPRPGYVVPMLPRPTKSEVETNRC